MPFLRVPERLYSLTPLLAALVAWAMGIRQYVESGVVVFYGNDTYGHLVTASRLKRAAFPPGIDSPALLQWFVGRIGLLLHTDPVDTYSFFALLSLPLMILSLGSLASALFGRRVGALAALIIGFVAIQPVQTYQDGTIPNIYAIGCIFPLALLCAHRSLTAPEKNRRLTYGIGALALLCALVLSHHLSTLVAVLSLACAAPLVSLHLGAKLRGRRRLLALIPLACVAALAIAAITFGSKSAAVALLGPTVSLSRTYPWVISHLGVAHIPWISARYGHEVGALPFQFGLAGAVALLIRSFMAKRQRESVIPLVLIGWMLVYWLGANSPYSYEPDRLARDLALPGSILAAYALKEAWALRKRLPFLVAAIFGAAFISAAFSGYHRYLMMTTHITNPYGKIDEQARAITIDKATGVVSSAPYWWSIAMARDEQMEWPLTRDNALTFVPDLARCLVLTNYKRDFAGLGVDAYYAAPLSLGSGYTSYHLEDDVVELRVYCRENPMAAVSQNTYTTGVKK